MTSSKSLIVLLALVVLVGVGGFAWYLRAPTNGTAPTALPPGEMSGTIGDMTLTSAAFDHGGPIPARYTCDGENVSPPLLLSGAPEGTRSIALIMEDPDVPTTIRADGMWNHWVVFNIPPDTTEIGEGKQPPGVRGIGTSGDLGYEGPCPPDREHRYVFKAVALDTTLDLAEGATKADVEQAMEGHILDHAELVGRYERR